MSTFEIGARVRLTEQAFSAYEIGQMGTLVEVISECDCCDVCDVERGQCWRVKMDDAPRGSWKSSDRVWPFYESEMEVV